MKCQLEKAEISNDLSNNRTVERFTNTPHGLAAATKLHPRGIQATTVPIPADFPRIPWDFRHPHPRADL